MSTSFRHFSFASILLVATSVLSMHMGGLRTRLSALKLELQQAMYLAKKTGRGRTRVHARDLG